MAGLIGIFDQLVEYERGLLQNIHRAGATRDLETARFRMVKMLNGIGAEGSIADILQTEKIIAQSDLEHFANSKPMRTSLTGTLRQIAGAVNMLEMIADADRYGIFAAGFTQPRNLKRGVPCDEARQFFASQTTRLTTMDKMRMDDASRAIVKARKANVIRADEAYAERQYAVLGFGQ